MFELVGEFTLENQQRLKQEEEKDQNKLDPWKVNTFDLVYLGKVNTFELVYLGKVKTYDLVYPGKVNTFHLFTWER